MVHTMPALLPHTMQGGKFELSVEEGNGKAVTGTASQNRENKTSFKIIYHNKPDDG